jgi:tungstate transport system ATP-binding protein
VRQTVSQCLEWLGLTALSGASARTLSGGERQKTAIARALAVKPKVLFLDEPTSNIDPHSALEIEHHIKQINRELGTTIMLVTHNLFQARRLADEVLFMWEGHMVEKGGRDIFTTARDQRTRDFLNGDTVF